MMVIKKIIKEVVTIQGESYSRFFWIIVGSFPLLFQLSLAHVFVWATGLVLGGWIAHKHPLRWIALAWIGKIVFPMMPFLLLACCGVLLRNWRDCLYSALLGLALNQITIPGEFKNMGTLLIFIGLLSIIYNRVK